jgi:hypothetical protein
VSFFFNLQGWRMGQSFSRQRMAPSPPGGFRRHIRYGEPLREHAHLLEAEPSIQLLASMPEARNAAAGSYRFRFLSKASCPPKEEGCNQRGAYLSCAAQSRSEIG